jgi:hypothetical protein
LLDQYDYGIIIGINSLYRDGGEFGVNHWIIVDGLVYRDGQYYVIIRDPLRTGNSGYDSLKQLIPGVTLEYSNGRILVSWEDFYTANKGMMIGVPKPPNKIRQKDEPRPM